MKASQLRNAVLQLAVQGKLVPQNPADEPASVLLERIKAEKEQLVRDKKIKREKPLAEITDEEKMFELPDGWVWVRLGEACINIHYGFNAAAQSLGNAKLLRITDIQNNKVNWDSVPYCEVNESECRTYALENRDIVIARTGGTIGKSYIVEKLNVKAVFASYLIRVIPPLTLDERYLKYYLESPYYWQQLKEKSMGTGQPNVNGTSLKQLIFTLPPIYEQQRIVAKIEEIMPKIDEYEKLEQELSVLEAKFPDNLKKSILQYAIQGKLVAQNPADEPASVLLEKIKAEKEQLVKDKKIKREKPLPEITEEEKPFELPEGWVWTRLGEVCNYGRIENCEPSKMDDNDWVLELEDIEKDTSKILFHKTKSERKPKSTKHKFSVENVLYGKLRPYLNKVVVVERAGYCSSEILPLDFRGKVNPYYAKIFLMSPHFVQYANQCSYGVKMPRLGTEDGKNAVLPLPPLAEQQRIVEKVDKLLVLCERMRK